MIKALAGVAGHELPSELNDLYGRISGVLGASIFAADIEATFRPPNDLTGLLRLCDLKPDTEGCSVPEKLIQHMELTERYLRKKFFVVLHLHSILTEDEMSKFLREVHCRELNLLMVETHLPYKVAAEQVRIIDCDLCEI